MGIASANRDEEKYEDPESFRLDRPQPRAHLTFGAGSHVCPGATLARLEAVIAVEVLLDRVERLETIDAVTTRRSPATWATIRFPHASSPCE
jgi:cytochrome P450